MDFFVVGALVRILILEQYYNIPIGVATLDIDIGVSILNWNHYEKLRESLILTQSFAPAPKIYHRLLFQDKYLVDWKFWIFIRTRTQMTAWFRQWHAGCRIKIMKQP
jgi:predicted nucleotidyltransferase